MVQLYADTFTRANNASSWGTASDAVNAWTKAAGTQTSAISSNEGTLSGATGINYMTLGAATKQDVDATLRLEISSVAVTNSHLGHLFRYISTTQAYAVTWDHNTGDLLVLKIAGSNTTLGSIAKSISASTFYWIRYRTQTIGTSYVQFLAKMWAASGSEPSDWDIVCTDTSSPWTSGNVGIRGSSANACTLSFDNLTINTVAQDTYAKGVRRQTGRIR